MELYQHQKEAIKQTSSFNRVAYYHDMGLGKTYTGSEKMIHLGANVNLVICQKSKINDWIEHFKSNYCKNDKDYCHEQLIFDLTNEKQMRIFINEVKCATEENFITDELTGQTYQQENLYPYYIVGIINYELAWRRKELSNLKDFTLMLDESSLIANDRSKRSKFIVKSLDPKNVILLSGTPVSGKYERLWSQCKLLGWNISKKEFYSKYIIEKELNIKRSPYPIKIVVGYKNVKHMKFMLKHYGCHFLKTEEVLSLPEQTFVTINVNQTKEYKDFKKNSIVTVDENTLIGENTLTKMLYQRQLCSVFNKNKIDAFKDLIDSTEDRLIVFYSFTNELNRLIESIGDRPFSIVNGSIKDLTMYENKDNSITFVQYQAGAMGLNLQKANKIIYFSLPLSCEYWMQSQKRIHRIGQKNTCFYYVLETIDSIEVDIKKALDIGVDYTDRLFDK